MSTANFRTMKNFPLYVYPTERIAYECHECGETFYEEGECPACGCEDAFEFDDGWFYVEQFMSCINPAIEELNRDLLFHTISIQSGYYTGLQIYVAEEHDLEEYEYDNEDCHYYFGCCRSVAHRKFYSERRKVCKALKKLAKEFGMDELFCVGVFSNGEAVYEKVEDTKRSRIRQAAFR